MRKFMLLCNPKLRRKLLHTCDRDRTLSRHAFRILPHVTQLPSLSNPLRLRRELPRPLSLRSLSSTSTTSTPETHQGPHSSPSSSSSSSPSPPSPAPSPSHRPFRNGRHPHPRPLHPLRLHRNLCLSLRSAPASPVHLTPSCFTTPN